MHLDQRRRRCDSLDLRRMPIESPVDVDYRAVDLQRCSDGKKLVVAPPVRFSIDRI